MTPLELLTCLVLIGISACMSASEIALFSLSRFQLRAIKEHFRPAHTKIKRLLSDPSGILVSILVVNEIVNISLSTIIAGAISRSKMDRDFGGIPSWAVDTLLGLAITTPIVLFVGEITPKVIAARINRIIAPLVAGPLVVVYNTMKPVRVSIRYLLSLVARFSGRGKTHPAREMVLKESDFLLMVEEGHKEGAVHESELELIKNVFELDSTSVADVFTPLSQVQTLPQETSIKGALMAMRSQIYSRIPVTTANRKQVVGILYSKDLLKAKLTPDLLNATIASIARKPLFVSPSMRLNALFRKFKQNKTHMAVVQGVQGAALGVVTMSDVLDTLFEDVLPEAEDREEEAPQ